MKSTLTLYPIGENAHGCEDGDIDINRAMKKMADTHTELQMYVNEIM
ncbi:hypothetical protein [Escherichia phage AV114]|nr:hypothetical protein [Escherichia phage AV114]